jgi:hypothetical protein
MPWRCNKVVESSVRKKLARMIFSVPVRSFRKQKGLNALLEALAGARVFEVVTFRPERGFLG